MIFFMLTVVCLTICIYIILTRFFSIERGKKQEEDKVIKAIEELIPLIEKFTQDLNNGKINKTIKKSNFSNSPKRKNTNE